MCQDPLVTVSERGHLPGVLYVEVGGSGVPIPESGARLALSSCVGQVTGSPAEQPGSSVHGIFQARVLEWVATAFSR